MDVHILATTLKMTPVSGHCMNIKLRRPKFLFPLFLPIHFSYFTGVADDGAFEFLFNLTHRPVRDRARSEERESMRWNLYILLKTQ